MSEEILPVDYEDEEDPDVYLRICREKWGRDSPWDSILSAYLRSMRDDRRFKVDTLNRGDLLAAYEAASWMVASLCQLESAYSAYLLWSGEAERPQFIRRRFLEDIAWFCFCLHTQATSGDWDAVAAIDLELASVRLAPARIGRHRKTLRGSVPPMYHHWASMAGLVAEFHRHATMRIFHGGGLEFFNSAMCAVPKELQKGGEDSPAFARTVASAWRGRKLGDEQRSGWEVGWLSVYDRLRESADFQQAATDLEMTGILDFSRRALAEFRLCDRIRAELKMEFAKAAKARLDAGLPLGNPAAEKRVNPRTPHEHREKLVCDYLESHTNPKRKDVARFVGCSVSTLLKVQAWQKHSARRPRGGTPPPTVVALTEKMLITQGQGEKDEVLNRLIEDHERDSEPSPLDDDPPGERPRQVKAHKRL